MRADIEERHRQVKCFWDLSRFHSTAWSLVVNQTVFVCLTYSLLQLHLLRQGFEELNRRTRPTIERLLPDGFLSSALRSDARSGLTAHFPARFTLVLAANPCPCARATAGGTGCTCAPLVRRRLDPITVAPKSQVNTVIPNAANGTNRALTSPCSSRAHSMDPTPIPTAPTRSPGGG